MDNASYTGFARYYDRLMQDAAYEQRAKRICALLRSCGVCKGDILDIACGTGSLTLPLLREGYSLIGVDQSPEMLQIAREKCEEAGFAPLLICQEMQSLDLYGTVDGAICMLDSLNHLPDEIALEQTFARLRLFLAPGAVLLFDVNTPYKHESILGDNSFVLEEEGLLCIWRNFYEPETQSVDILLDIFEEDENGRYTRCCEQFCERAFPLETIRAMLHTNGFTLEGIYDDISDEAVGAKTQRALFVALRKGR